MKIILKAIICLFVILPETGLGQTFPEFGPVIPLSVLSTAESNEALPLLAPDGQTLYFIRTESIRNFNATREIHQIWLSERTESGWSPEQKADSPLTGERNTAVVGIGSDNQLFLFGSYAKRGSPNGISISAFKDGKWTYPDQILIPGISDKNNNLGLYMHPSGKTLLISMMNGDAEDLYVSLREKKSWSEPIPLGKKINTSGYEIAPYLSDNQQYLFFSRGDDWNDADIYVTERLDDSWTEWSEPKRLPEPINSEAFDAYLSISADSSIYFTSDRNGSSDLFSSYIVKPAEPEFISAVVEININAPLDLLPVAETTPIEDETDSSIAEPAEDSQNYDLESHASADLLSHELIDELSGTVYFKGQEIAPYQRLDDIVATLVEASEKYSGFQVELIAYETSLMQVESGLNLPLARADKLLSLLVKSGLNPMSISITKMDQALPITNPGSEITRHLNERVDIQVSRISPNQLKAQNED